MTKRASISIYFDARNLPVGNFSVRWSVYYDRKQKLFPTGMVIDEKDMTFLKANRELSGRIKDEERRLLWHKVYGDGYYDEITNKHIPSLLESGRRAVAKIEGYFSFELFANVVSGDYDPEMKKQYPTDLLEALRLRQSRLEEEDSLGNAALFRSTEFSFRRFAISRKITSDKAPRLPMAMVTAKFLQEYERWMLKEGKSAQPKRGQDGTFIQRKGTPASITMVGIYCRNVRTIFNEAIAAKVIDRDAYPFSSYVIPQSINKKKALDSKVISEIFYFECTKSAMEYNRDLWVFSYLANGINFTDMFSIKWKDVNISTSSIRFYREKTKRTKRDDISEIVIDLNPITVAILDKWGTADRKSDDYVFPVVDVMMDAREKKKCIKQAIKVNNAWMGKITKALGYEYLEVKTYAARHSFATTLVRSEAPLAFISGKLGHGSLATTQKYIGSFEMEQSQKYLSALIPKKMDEA